MLSICVIRFGELLIQLRFFFFGSVSWPKSFLSVRMFNVHGCQWECSCCSSNTLSHGIIIVRTLFFFFVLIQTERIESISWYDCFNLVAHFKTLVCQWFLWNWRNRLTVTPFIIYKIFGQVNCWWLHHFGFTWFHRKRKLGNDDKRKWFLLVEFGRARFVCQRLKTYKCNAPNQIKAKQSEATQTKTYATSHVCQTFDTFNSIYWKNQNNIKIEIEYPKHESTKSSPLFLFNRSIYFCQWVFFRLFCFLVLFLVFCSFSVHYIDFLCDE